MKILHLGQMIGGLDVYIRNTITYVDNSFEYVIVHGDEDKSEPVIKNGKAVAEYKISLYRSLNPLNDLKSLIQSIKIIKTEKPDVIHCHSAKGGVIGRIAGWICGVRTFYTPHAFSFLSTPSKLKSSVYLLLEKICRLNSNILACSESEAEIARKHVHYKNSHIFTWHNCVPTVNYNIHKDSSSNSNYITYIGRPSYQKNPLFLVDVINEVHKVHPEIKFQLLGVGYYSPMLDEMKAKIKEYHLDKSIELLPWLSHDETLRHVSDSLFYLTVSRYEGLPLAVIEAMSLGKAIIASEVVGNKDCVKDGYNGWLVSLDDEKGFSSAINSLIENGKQRKEYGENSRIYYEEEFTIEKRIHLLEEIYTGI